MVRLKCHGPAVAGHLSLILNRRTRPTLNNAVHLWVRTRRFRGQSEMIMARWEIGEDSLHTTVIIS